MCFDSPKAALPSDGVVRLDDFRLSDAPTLVSADYDPEHRRRFEIPDAFVPSLQHAERTLATWTAEKEAGTRFAFAVRGAQSGELLGGCELRPIGRDVAQLSYWTHPTHRSRGIGSRAVALLCRWAFEQLRVIHLELAIDPDNLASRRVAARNGFTEQGLHEGRVRYGREMPHTE